MMNALMIAILSQVAWPIDKDSKWTYVSGEKEMTLRVDGTEEIQLFRGGKVKAWVLVGWEKDPAYLVERENGVLIVAERQVGYAGTPAFVTIADLRWGKEETWTFETMSGCLRWDVKCSKKEEDGLLKITVGEDVYWLKDGLVKFTREAKTWSRRP